MQVVDTMFAGRLGPEVIAGVSIGNAVFVVFMAIGVGLLLGLDFLVSFSYGAGKLEDCNKAFVQGLYVATGLAVPFIALMYGASFTLFPHLHLEPAVAAQASTYLKALCWSIWPLFVFSACRQYLQAIGIANAVMVILVLANLVNAFCNWVFVMGNLGVQSIGISGSGLSTVIARMFMLITLLLYMARVDKRRNLGLRHISWKFYREKTFLLIKLGAPAGMQMLLEVGVFAASTLLAGTLGAKNLAAHQVVLHVASLTFMIAMGLSAAGSVGVGQALGRQQLAYSRTVGWSAIKMISVFMASCGVFFYLLPRPIMMAFTQDEQVIQVGKGLLMIAAFFQLFDGIQVVATGILRGMGDTRSSMLANLVGHWFVGLPIGASLCFLAGFGAYGLWIGLCSGLVFVAVSLLWVWKKRSAAVVSGALHVTKKRVNA